MWENFVVMVLVMEYVVCVVGEDEGEVYMFGLLCLVGKFVFDMLFEVVYLGVSCFDLDMLELLKWECVWVEIISNEVGVMIFEEWKMFEFMYSGVFYYYGYGEVGNCMVVLLYVVCWMMY